MEKMLENFCWNFSSDLDSSEQVDYHDMERDELGISLEVEMTRCVIVDLEHVILTEISTKNDFQVSGWKN